MKGRVRFGLSPTAVTVCAALAAAVTLAAFLRSGQLNLPGGLFLFLIFVGVARIVRLVISIRSAPPK